MAVEHYLIIGNGIAGVTAAEILRAEAPNAQISVVADDPFPVYYRPALKDYLAGRVHEDKLWARSGSFYQDHNIQFMQERVTGIQVGQHTVQLQSGSELPYTRLLLANGAHASRLTCPGSDLEGVTTLRTVADYQATLNRLPNARRVVVVGSGTLALETIETLRHRGFQVIHLIRRHRLWSEVLDQTASDLVLQQERRDGVDVRLEEEIAEITGGNGQVKGIVTTHGTRIACEMVLIAIGVEPNIDFIKRSGIGCGRGIKVDGTMHTNAPDIYAAGDVLETLDATSGRVRVLGQWFPAVQQSRVAAYSMLNMLDSKASFRSDTFYNATFLYGLDFAAVGVTSGQGREMGYQELVADPQPRTYRKVILKDGVPVGMLLLGNRKQGLALKRAIDYRVNLQPVAAQLFADDFKLNEWLDRQGVPPPLLGFKRTSSVQGGEIAEPTDVLSTITLLPMKTEEMLRLSETRIPPSGTQLVGRQAGVFLLIDHGSVSRRHAELSVVNGQLTVCDLGSSNGTFVNNSRLEPQQPQALKNNDTVRFGKQAIFRVRITEAAKPPTKPRANNGASMAGFTQFAGAQTTVYQPATRPASVSMSQPILQPDGTLRLPESSVAIPAAIVESFKSTPTLIVLMDGATPQAIALHTQKVLSIGRDKGNDLRLSDIVASRRHAEVAPGPEGFYIRDLGSSNGVTVNQTRIDNPYLLKHGDRITIGSSRIYYMYTPR